MFIYILKSILFEGQERKIITNFPIRDREKLEFIANSDNTYPKEKGWLLFEIK